MRRVPEIEKQLIYFPCACCIESSGGLYHKHNRENIERRSSELSHF